MYIMTNINQSEKNGMFLNLKNYIQENGEICYQPFNTPSDTIQIYDFYINLYPIHQKQDPMNSYKNGKIYLIKHKDFPKNVYIGFTVKDLECVFNTHKKDVFSIGKFVAEYFNNNWDDRYIELYEDYPCNNIQELRKRKGEIQHKLYNENYYLINVQIHFPNSYISQYPKSYCGNLSKSKPFD